MVRGVPHPNYPRPEKHAEERAPSLFRAVCGLTHSTLRESKKSQNTNKSERREREKGKEKEKRVRERDKGKSGKQRRMTETNRHKKPHETEPNLRNESVTREKLRPNPNMYGRGYRGPAMEYREDISIESLR